MIWCSMISVLDYAIWHVCTSISCHHTHVFTSFVAAFRPHAEAKMRLVTRKWCIYVLYSVVNSISYRAVSHPMTSYNIISNIVWNRIISAYVIKCHIMQYRTKLQLYWTTSYHIISYHIVDWSIISYHERICLAIIKYDMK